MSAFVCVKGRNAHQSVHPLFGFEIPVSIVAENIERNAFYARLVSVQPVGDFRFVAATLGVTGVHPEKHTHPVLSFRAARARVQRQNRVVAVVFAGQQRFYMQRFRLFRKRLQLRLHFHKVVLVVGQSNKLAQIFRVFFKSRKKIQPVFYVLCLTADLLSRGNVVPEIFFLLKLFKLL